MDRRTTALPSQQQQQQRHENDAAARTANRLRVTNASLVDGAVLGQGNTDALYRTVVRYPGLPDVDDLELVVTYDATETPVSIDRKKSSDGRQRSTSTGKITDRHHSTLSAHINDVDHK